MRLARIAHPDGVSFAALQSPTTGGGEPTAGDVCAEIAEHPFGDPTFTGRTWPLADVRLLAPILPSKVVCIGKNYAEHVAEMGGGDAPANPLIFLKPSTTVIGPGLPILRPPDSQRVDYEGELAVVIGQPCRDVAEARARDVVLGYTVANDVTARDLQSADGQWTRAKGYDSFCPLGPWIETSLDPSDLAIETTLDDATVQKSRTSMLIHGIEKQIAYISRVMTLLPGDTILTGTPAGVGPDGRRADRLGDGGGHRDADEPGAGPPVSRRRGGGGEAESTSQDWVATLADEVIAAARKEDPDEGRTIVCASGLSPSGPIHLGNLREVLTPHLVADEIPPPRDRLRAPHLLGRLRPLPPRPEGGRGDRRLLGRAHRQAADLGSGAPGQRVRELGRALQGPHDRRAGAARRPVPRGVADADVHLRRVHRADAARDARAGPDRRGARPVPDEEVGRGARR